MLILLSDRFEGRLGDLAAASGFLEALGNLAQGYRNGAHIVAGPVRVLKEIIEIVSGDARGIFREIKLRLHEFRALRDLVTHRVVVEPDAGGEIRQEQVGDQCSIHVPYTYFADLERTGRTRLVTEDGDDATIYEAAVQGYGFRTRQAKSLRIALQTYGGGGHNTADAVRDHARHGITLCVADSDRKWPVGPKGRTAAEIERMQAALARESILGVLILPCHELENILPGRLLLDVHDNDAAKDLCDRCQRAHDLGFLGAADPLYHLDLKKGLCFRDVVDAPDRSAKRGFLDRVFREHRDRALLPSSGWCDADPDCIRRDECRCVLFEGLGGGVVKRCAERARSRLTPQKSAEYFFAPDLACREVWDDLCRQIFSWACAYKRARA